MFILILIIVLTLEKVTFVCIFSDNNLFFFKFQAFGNIADFNYLIYRCPNREGILRLLPNVAFLHLLRLPHHHLRRGF